MAYDCSMEEERLQKKLIPLNIVVCVLCLVAIISLLVTPLIKIDLGAMMQTVMSQTDTSGGSGDGSGGSGDGSGSGGDNTSQIVMDAFKDMDAVITFTPINMGQMAFSNQNAFETFVDTLLVKTGVLDQVMVSAMNMALISQNDVDVSEMDLSGVEAKFRALGNVHSEAEMRVAAAEWVDELNKLVPGTVTEAEKSAVCDEFATTYNETVEATGGPYDLEKFICYMASVKGMELETPVTDYSSLVKTMMNSSGSEGGGMDTAQLDTAMGAMSKGLFGLSMFTCGVWFVLFLFSLFHIFAANKRFMMWYVKMFGAIPCFFFGVMPSVLGGALASAGGEAAVYASIFGSITTLTWISGGCWLALWLVSIFWAFPIKRKIRQDRKS